VNVSALAGGAWSQPAMHRKDQEIAEFDPDGTQGERRLPDGGQLDL